MPVMPERELRVRPFRGVRYDPARVSSLAAVTSPPYDVIDPDDATLLEALDPHNVVRVILPRPGASGADRYEQAHDTLQAWLADGVLRPDGEPALYVYEQSRPDFVQRGIIAAVGLHDPADRVVLPHEDVMPGPVADRLGLMRATGANPEPILLVLDGGDRTAALVREVCATPPLLESRVEDGLTQRLWAVTDPTVHVEVEADLAPCRALIADGHHRYATYRRLQAEHHDAGHGAGPWDYGLAFLVDSRSEQLQVQAIHRVVAGLSLADAVDQLAGIFQTRSGGPDLDSALETLGHTSAPYAYLLTDGRTYVLAEHPDEAAVTAAFAAEQHSELWRALDASLLHALLLEKVWGIDDTGDRIRYVHDTEHAVAAAGRHHGVAVLLRPVQVGVVAELAARGERMPRKSTSFGPKPRTGLVLRLLDLDS
jgi:uncharacterized protein (DUF1015 family)